MNFFCSWSGGKDSCLSLYKAISLADLPKVLFTACIEEGGRSRSHGLSMDILQAQALSLGIPLVTVNTAWDQYRDHFVSGIRALKKQDPSITRGVFGDMDIEAHRQWEKEVCAECEMKAYLPLWQMERKYVLKTFLEVGFKAIIISVNTAQLNPEKYLGRVIDEMLCKELEAINVDPCGENGEYHTVVFDGPIFKQPLLLEKGLIMKHESYCFLDLKLSSKKGGLL